MPAHRAVLDGPGEDERDGRASASARYRLPHAGSWYERDSAPAGVVRAPPGCLRPHRMTAPSVMDHFKMGLAAER
jgi:hypothetical protein